MPDVVHLHVLGEFVGRECVMHVQARTLERLKAIVHHPGFVADCQAQQNGGRHAAAAPQPLAGGSAGEAAPQASGVVPPRRQPLLGGLLRLRPRLAIARGGAAGARRRRGTPAARGGSRRREEEFLHTSRHLGPTLRLDAVVAGVAEVVVAVRAAAVLRAVGPAAPGPAPVAPVSRLGVQDQHVALGAAGPPVTCSTDVVVAAPATAESRANGLSFLGRAGVAEVGRPQVRQHGVALGTPRCVARSPELADVFAPRHAPGPLAGHLLDSAPGSGGA
mmetsp:Transcript_43087/g.138524  ORF Transcript_43087/g.138524 Transcript_43087/m.138524 type:complete len:276 (+) Transcript_43087:1219-2046(+)